MTTYEEVCHREASALPGGEIAVRTLLDWEIARAKLSDTDYIEAIRSHGPCDVANVTAADLIEAFGGDVELLIVLARRLAPDGATSRLVPEGPGSGTETPGCGPFSDCALCTWTSRQVEELDAALGPLPAGAVDRVNQGLLSRFHFYPHPLPHWLLWAFTLAFAYHKLVPTCSRADPVVAGGLLGKPSWRCTQADMDRLIAEIPDGMDHDGQIVYDVRGVAGLEPCRRQKVLTFRVFVCRALALHLRAQLLPIDPTRGFCFGELCQRATAALDDYHNLLHVVTPVRTALSAFHLLSIRTARAPLQAPNSTFLAQHLICPC